MSGSQSISADIGGTFTDVIIVDADGNLRASKSPTVPDDPAQGVLAALAAAGASLETTQRFFHGTTIGINALLERRGTAVGFLTTQGFRDLLTIGDGSWPPYRLTWQRPPALVPRRRCLEVRERILSDGSVERAVDEADVLARVEELLELGAESIAICFYNSYREPRHEQLAGAAIRARYPDLPVVLSHELTRRYREVERASTTVAEAYLRPRMQRYYSDLAAGLERSEFTGQLLITTSDGGVMGRRLAEQRALRTLVSGCAGGVSGAAFIGAQSGWPDLLTIDVGGTSFDAAIIRGGEPAMIHTAEIAGLRFQVPMIDLATIGAGGGSIASIDSAGGLSVGPRSAGSVPGPVCYDRGGTQPTFTDAALVAGRLPVSLLDGGMGMRLDLASAAISREVAEPLGMSVQEASAGIMAVIEARMAQTLEELTMGRGLDPRDFTMMAFGGGGPMVATRLAQELGIRRVVVPRHPGAFSAFGMQMLDIAHEFSRTQVNALAEMAPGAIESILDELCAEAATVLAAELVAPGAVQLLRAVEMRYDGQEHALLVPMPADPAQLPAAFGAAHTATFGFAIDEDIEIVGYRVRAIGVLDKPDIAEIPAGSGDPVAAFVGEREVHERGGAGGRNWPVYRRHDLRGGDVIMGPAIVEELTATTVVSDGFRLEVSALGHLLMESRPAR